MQAEYKFILGIETSCDETSAAIISPTRVLSNIISSQAVHVDFGGVVPELASRAHVRKIIPIVEEALSEASLKMSEIDGLAIAHGPGLIGALLVGLNYVKGLSMALDIPFVGVNHIEGHIYANFLNGKTVPFPFICLVVSGGHTQIVLVKDHIKYRILGETRDDAVGEAFDKVAKLLGLPYPGGPRIDQLSNQGNPDFVEFPRALMKGDNFDFSYSGLKTSVLNKINELGEKNTRENLANLCASFQKAAIEVLVKKTIAAARNFQVRDIVLAGGVAANSLLRSWISEDTKAFHLNVAYPPLEFCTDNAAMIARAGLEHLKRKGRDNLALNVYPSLRLPESKQD
jgi:N6-L-threonylcarbamoyladenine synthase